MSPAKMEAIDYAEDYNRRCKRARAFLANYLSSPTEEAPDVVTLGGYPGPLLVRSMAALLLQAEMEAAERERAAAKLRELAARPGALDPEPVAFMLVHRGVIACWSETREPLESSTYQELMPGCEIVPLYSAPPR